MGFDFPPYAIAFVLNAFVALLFGLVTLTRRNTTGWKPFFWAMLAMADWSIARALEAGALDISSKVFWSKIEWIGILCFPPLWLAFAIEYSQNIRWIHRKKIFLFWIIPVITILLCFTNEWHKLIWRDIQPNPTGDSSILVYSHGAWFWFAACNNYFVLLLATILLVRSILYKPKPFRLQVWVLLIGLAIPLIGNLIYLTGLSPVKGLDLTPFGFTLSAILFGLSLFRFRLFALAPVAREVLFEQINDAVVVFDAKNHISDYNPAATFILNPLTKTTIGLAANKGLSIWSYIKIHFTQVQEAKAEIHLNVEGQARILDMRITPLYDRQNVFQGRVMVLRDITQSHQAREQLLRNEERYRILTQSIDDIIYTLDCQERYTALYGKWLEREAINPAVFLGRTATEIFGEEAGVLHRAANRRALGGENIIYEWSTTEAEGKRHFQTSLSPIYEDGEVTGIVGVGRDITLLKQTEQAEHEQRSLAEALRDTADAFNSTLELDEILDRILINLEKVVPYDAANYCIVDDNGVARFVRARGYSSQEVEDYLLSLKYPIHEMPQWKAIVETGKPVLVPDTTAHDGWIIHPKTSWIRSYVGAPILVNKLTVGIINLDSATPDFFSPKHLDRLQAFANQAAIAIQKANLFTETRRRADELATLNRIGIALTSGFNLKRVLRELHWQCQQVLPIDCFFIALYDETTEQILTPLFFEAGEYLSIPPRKMKEHPGLTGYIIQTKQTIYLPDLADKQNPPPAEVIPIGGPPPRSFVGSPLMLGDKLIGVISMQSYIPNAFSTEHIHLLETIASQASIAIENARLFEQMEQLATIDSLTGLNNSRHFFFLAENEVERARRYNRKLTAIMMDIDHFKNINDTYGHKAGDQLLHALASQWLQELRKIDIIGRYCGEEFVLILPETGVENAARIAERLRQTVENISLTTPSGIIHITASIGLANLDKDCTNLDQLLEHADLALYTAKAAGRNQVKLYKHEAPQK